MIKIKQGPQAESPTLSRTDTDRTNAHTGLPRRRQPYPRLGLVDKENEEKSMYGTPNRSRVCRELPCADTWAKKGPGLGISGGVYRMCVVWMDRGGGTPSSMRLTNWGGGFRIGIGPESPTTSTTLHPRLITGWLASYCSWNVVYIHEF